MKYAWERFKIFLKKNAGLPSFMAAAAALSASYAVQDRQGIRQFFVEVTIYACELCYVACFLNLLFNFLIPFIRDEAIYRFVAPSENSQSSVETAAVRKHGTWGIKDEVKTEDKTVDWWKTIKKWIKLIVAISGIIASLFSLVIARERQSFAWYSIVSFVSSLCFSIIAMFMLKKERTRHRKYWFFVSLAVIFLVCAIILCLLPAQPQSTRDTMDTAVEMDNQDPYDETVPTDDSSVFKLVTQTIPNVETERPVESKQAMDTEGNPVEQVYISFSYKLQPNTVPSDERLVYSGPSTDYYQPASEPGHEMRISKSNRHDCAGIDNGWYLVKYFSTIAGKDRIGYVKRVSNDRSNAIAFSFANRKMKLGMNCSLTDGVENYRKLYVGTEVLYLGTLFADNLINGVASPYAYIEYEEIGIRYRGVIPLAALFGRDDSKKVGSDEVIIPASTPTTDIYLQVEDINTDIPLFPESIASTPVMDDGMEDIKENAEEEIIYFFEEMLDEPIEKSSVDSFKSKAEWRPVGSKTEVYLHHPDAENYRFYTQVVTDGILEMEFKIHADGYKNMTEAEYEELLKKTGHDWRISVMDGEGYFYKELFISRQDSVNGGKAFYFDLPYGLYFFEISIMMHDSIQWKINVDTALTAETESMWDGVGY